eukprot:TRINITY_DN3244_c0_g1_i2.p1 TRINITY_DN3244_c0_g1~~TRINITY_DN3244_c0_g1_i2.p1  ORF type:complete len:408 (-),score=94.37 TRINITY_DN3244_c0_g1_i2:53-1276(-)
MDIGDESWSKVINRGTRVKFVQDVMVGWKRIARFLGFSDSDIAAIEERYPGKLEEQTEAFLSSCKNRAVKYDRLLDALEGTNHNAVATFLRQSFSGLPIAPSSASSTSSTSYQPLPGHDNPQKTANTKKTVDILLISVVPTERKGLREVLSHAHYNTKKIQLNEDDFLEDGTPITWGTVTTPRRGTLNLALVMQHSMGGEGNSTLVMSLLQHLTFADKAVVMMIGILAGVRTETQLFDVLIPLKAIRSGEGGSEGPKQQYKDDVNTVSLDDSMASFVKLFKADNEDLVNESIKVVCGTKPPSKQYMGEVLLNLCSKEYKDITELFAEIEKTGFNDQLCSEITEQFQKKNYLDSELKLTDEGKKVIHELRMKRFGRFPKPDPPKVTIHFDDILTRPNVMRNLPEIHEV